MRVGWLVLIPFLMLGCTDQQRDEVAAQSSDLGRQAVSKVASVAEEAWKRAQDQASKLDSHSAADALQSAKDQLERAKDNLQPGKRLEEAKAEIERLRAALDVHKLQKEMDDKVAEAQRLKENAGKSLDDVRQKLDEADQTYRDLKNRLDGAESAYDSATTKVDEIKKQISL